MSKAWKCPHCGCAAGQHRVMNVDPYEIACVLNAEGGVSDGEIGFVQFLIREEHDAVLAGDRLVREQPLRRIVSELESLLAGARTTIATRGDQLAACEEELNRHRAHACPAPAAPPPAAATPLLNADERTMLDAQVDELRQKALAAEPAHCHHKNCKRDPINKITVSNQERTVTVHSCDNTKHVTQAARIADDKLKGAIQ
jgi:hypothetical protein